MSVRREDIGILKCDRCKAIFRTGEVCKCSPTERSWHYITKEEAKKNEST